MPSSPDNERTAARVLVRCAASLDGVELCDEARLRYDAADRDEAVGLDVSELRGIARRLVHVHLAEQQLRGGVTP
jgi:hypothetical protein